MRLLAMIMLAPAAAAALASPILAQTPGGTVQGVVRDSAGRPLAGARVTASHRSAFADSGTGGEVWTDAQGRYRIAELRPGPHTLTIRLIGFVQRRETVVVAAGAAVVRDVVLVPTAVQLDAVVVSATGERERLAATPAAIGQVPRTALATTRPAHPSEVMNRLAGVWVNATSGEGHTMAIRQPLTTDPVYLYLEDGIPSRSTGFFNHNALYEINLPQSDGVEVIKGPGTALYGSDAVGGVINVATRPPSTRPQLDLGVEAGAWGFARLLASASGTVGRDGLRADVNYTRTDGWRDATGYDRRSATVRWDRYVGSARLKTVIAWSAIDQQTAGASAIAAADFDSAPHRNYTPISFRDVGALRVSSAYERQGARSLLSITPFARWNAMEMIPNWTLAFDPQHSWTENTSLGLLARWRRDFDALDARLIVGLDADYSPGSRRERIIGVTRQGRDFTAFRDSTLVYDYDVRFHGISPYVHVEVAPSSLPGLRLAAGARYDALAYTYDNHLADTAAGRWRRPADTSLSYRRLSPKLGVTYRISPAVALFGAWRAGFRAPSEGQVFRQGSALNTVGLRPVRVASWELGVRGRVGERVTYDVTAYTMTKRDDILSHTLPSGATETVNAGRTSHRGLEVSLGAEILDGLTLSGAYTYGRHRYEEWRPDTTDYSGHDIDVAPRGFGSVQARYAPAKLGGGDVAVDVTRMGWYFMEPGNAPANIYWGHTVLNLRASVVIGHATVFARLMNATNTRYAERATWTAARGQEYAPGLPRTLYLGVQYR
jgi:outer membrane receptor protein involved in Fe transport